MNVSFLMTTIKVVVYACLLPNCIGPSAAATAGTAHMREGAKSGLHHKGANKKSAGWWAVLTGQSQSGQALEEVEIAQVCSSSSFLCKACAVDCSGCSKSA